MNEFKESLKVDITHKKDYTEKVADAVYKAILDVKPENEEEKMKQTELLHNINKFIYEFEKDSEFRTLLSNYEYSKKFRIIKQNKESEER